MEVRDQPGADQDHSRTQDQRTDDADHEGALLELDRYGEVSEQHQKDEDVVDRERFLDEVTCYELERLFIRERLGDPQRRREGERQFDPFPY